MPRPARLLCAVLLASSVVLTACGSGADTASTSAPATSASSSASSLTGSSTGSGARTVAPLQHYTATLPATERFSAEEVNQAAAELQDYLGEWALRADMNTAEQEQNNDVPRELFHRLEYWMTPTMAQSWRDTLERAEAAVDQPAGTNSADGDALQTLTLFGLTFGEDTPPPAGEDTVQNWRIDSITASDTAGASLQLDVVQRADLVMYRDGVRHAAALTRTVSYYLIQLGASTDGQRWALDGYNGTYNVEASVPATN